MTLDVSKYIIKTKYGEVFDIHSYEDDEQMLYLKREEEKRKTCKVVVSSSPVSSFLSRFKKIKDR
jgi:hypothetical protein